MDGALSSNTDAISGPARTVGDLVAGRYELEQLVGCGGGGAVYQARDRLLDRQVAVKILTISDDEMARRLAVEGRLLARLQHPNIVDVYDAGENGNAAFLVMEYVAGGSLRDLLARHGPLSPAMVAGIGWGVARALAAAHAAGICHRDIKPANILLPDSGGSRLVDFGIARMLDQTAITVTGLVVGTPQYLSPEQALGQGAGPPSDVYSLGLVLLESLTGHRPFPGTLAESMGARLSTDPAIPEWLDPPWVSILKGATRGQPSDRLTAAEMSARLGPMAASATMPARVGGMTADPAADGVTTAPMRLSAAGALAGPTRPPTTGMAVPILESTTPTLFEPGAAPRTEPWPHARIRRHRGRQVAVAAAILLAALALGLALAGYSGTSGTGRRPTSATTTSPPSTTATTVVTTPPPAVSSPTTAGTLPPKGKVHGGHRKTVGPPKG